MLGKHPSTNWKRKTKQKQKQTSSFKKLTLTCPESSCFQAGKNTHLEPTARSPSNQGKAAFSTGETECKQRALCPNLHRIFPAAVPSSVTYLNQIHSLLMFSNSTALSKSVNIHLGLLWVLIYESPLAMENILMGLSFENHCHSEPSLKTGEFGHSGYFVHLSIIQRFERKPFKSISNYLVPLCCFNTFMIFD